MIATNIAEAAVSIAEAQAYARIETGEEEALIAGLVRTASALCEAFVGQVLVARPFEEMLPAGIQWQRLTLTPVRSIDEVEAVAVDGSVAVLAAGNDGSIAAFTAGGWRFVAPVEGLRVLNRANGETLLHRNGSWEAGIVRGQELRIGGQTVVSSRQPAIGDPFGGAVIDSECRSAVAQLLAAVRAHGLIG